MTISLLLLRNASFTNSIEIEYSGNVFEAVKNTHSTCFKHYLKQLQKRSRAACIVSSLGYETRSQKILKFLIKIALDKALPSYASIRDKNVHDI